MIKLQGKRNSAIVFADKLDRPTKTQICELLREEAYSDSKIRIMPDTHSGKNVAVGTTMTVKNRIAPSLVGVDIGCGMEVVFLKEQDFDPEKLDGIIHSIVPSGTKIQDVPVASFDFDNLRCKSSINLERAHRSIGTLGGGNHFIEVDRSEAGELVLVIHSGSRQLGSDVAKYYQDQAYRYQCKKQRKRARQSYYDDTDSGRFFSKKTSQNVINVKRETAVLEGSLLEQYLHDLDIVVSFADLNRRTIAKLICDNMGFTVTDRFSCVHNYIDTKYMILRKGAISARLGERVIIPLNMRDGALLGTGKGNPEWNFSAPHGAGRAYSRTEAKYAFAVEEFKRVMEGIYTTTATEGSIDECPMAYKEPSRIFEFIGETLSDYEVIKPIYNFKSC